MRVESLDAMYIEAARFVAELRPRADGATVVALEGDLGAGKTAFVKGIARALGVEEYVASPTFVIMKIYSLQDQVFDRLVHIDAYRLKGKHHLDVLGWSELLVDPHNLICVEWPERAGDAIPESAIRVSFRYSGENGREITYH